MGDREICRPFFVVGVQVRETNKAKQAFEDYFNQGPGRSLRSLIQTYNEPATKKPPTKHLRTIATWSKNHDWQERVAQRNAEISEAQLDAIKLRAIESGYAFWPKRVFDLIDLAELLFEEINTESKRWMPDVKQIGSGENAERVDLVRFNHPLIDQYRKVLGDIAAELNERVRGFELSGKDGGPIELKELEGTRLKRWEQVQEKLERALSNLEDDEDIGD